VLTAADLVHALPRHLLRVVHEGAAGAVTGLEFVDADLEATAHPGDLLLATAPLPDLPARLEALARRGAAPAAGLVVRRSALTDELTVCCERLSLTVVVLADGVSWSLVLGLLQAAVDQARRAEGVGAGSLDELFALAEHIEGVIEAPVTIEDAHSRVLAYSSRQSDTDPARVSTIIGRRVPREVREHFRAHGVFRRLATSDEPFLVAGFQGGAGTPWVRPRLVVPVRAGATWLGSIWAVRDEAVTGERLVALRGAADVVALHLLRLRARAELGRQLSVEQVRAALRGEPGDAPLGPGPWRAVALAGPAAGTTAEARRELWASLARRHGWPAPLVADLGDAALAVVSATGDGPGSWDWWQALTLAHARRDPTAYASAGPAVRTVAELPGSRRLAVEQLATVADRPVSTTEDLWPRLTVCRAVATLEGLPDPLAPVRAHDEAHGTELGRTLAVVLDHWAEPRRSAARLGVHANTVRYRMEQVRALLGPEVDLGDPDVRLALSLGSRA